MTLIAVLKKSIRQVQRQRKTELDRGDSGFLGKLPPLRAISRVEKMADRMAGRWSDTLELEPERKS